MAEDAIPLLVWTTFPEPESARRIARTLVEERFAACANVLGGVESVYRWQGKVESAAEVWVLFKTTREAYPRLETRLKALHPYELPEIIALKPDCGLPAYLQWIAENC
ncbi:MAG: divalent-cation tolerance protein CutA [Chthoniobacteraceae bacterium]|nr:divalent-cation tolerance protein CutA [Chthoniobacteraceae bacterium]